MKRNVVRPAWLVAVLLSLLATLAGGVSWGQALPPGPTLALRSTYQAVNPPAQFELVQLVLDFAPGAFTPVHTHGGAGFVTVIEGEMTRRVGSMEQAFKTGEGWVEPGEDHLAGNASGANARVLVSFLLPKGAPLTTVGQTGETGQPPPGPTVVAQFRTDMTAPPPSPYDVEHLVLDFAPGAFTPSHIHGGPALVTVVQGEMVRRQAGLDQTFRVGETWVEPTGFHAAGNATQRNARVAVTFLLPKNVPLTTVEPHASDGQRLSTQPVSVQAAFAAVWGDNAAQRWVQEHEAELARRS